MKIVLQPMEEQTVAARGETVVYLNGSEPLLITASGKRAEIPSTSQVRFDVFNEVKFQNKGLIAAEFEIFIVEGEFRSLAEGSKVITDISNTSDINTPIVLKLVELMESTLSTEVSNASDINSPVVQKLIELMNSTLSTEVSNASDINSPVVQKLVELMNSTLSSEVSNASDISTPVVQKLSELIGSTIKTQDQSATSLKESIHSFSAGLSHTIEANTARRDITVLAASQNTGSVIVGGMPLSAGQFINLENYTGSINTLASELTDKIYITEVIK